MGHFDEVTKFINGKNQNVFSMSIPRLEQNSKASKGSNFNLFAN